MSIHEIGLIYNDMYENFILCTKDEVLDPICLPYETKLAELKTNLDELNQQTKEGSKQAIDIREEMREAKSFIENRDAQIIIARTNWCRTEKYQTQLARLREISQELWGKK